MADERRQRAPNTPSAGNDSNAIIMYDGFGNLTFQPGNVNFVEYSDGTVIRSNTPTETIIGSLIAIPAMQVVGPSPDIPGAFGLTPVTPFAVELGTDFYLSSGLMDVLLIPDTSVVGFDSVLQALLFWNETELGLVSRYLDELDATAVGPAVESTLQFRTFILGATANLTKPGSSPGTVSVTNTIVVP